MSSPTQRSLALLRKEGFVAQVVEKYNPYARVRVDLFGFIDIVAIKKECGKCAGINGVVGVQTTSAAHIMERVRKILSIPESKIWLECGNKIIVHGWSKKGAKDKRKLWSVNTKEVLLSDY